MFDVYYWKSSFVWFSIAIRKVGLTNSICVTENKILHIARKSSLINSMSLVGKMNSVGFLDLIYIVVAELNHLIDDLLD